MMRSLLLPMVVVLMTATVAGALPALQLFIAGAEYDFENDAWVTDQSSFDLYVISANQSRDDVLISLALGQ